MTHLTQLVITPGKILLTFPINYIKTSFKHRQIKRLQN